MRHVHDFTVDETVAVEIESINLDFRPLAGMDEADVAIQHHGFNLKVARERHNDQQGRAGVATPPIL